MTKKYIFTYGLTLGTIFVFYGIFLYITDNVISRPRWFALINTVILISVISYGIYAYKSANTGFLKLSEALKIGMGIVLIGGMMAIIWNFILMKVIAPDMESQIVDIKRNAIIENNPEMSQEQINQAILFAEKLSTPYATAAFSLIGSLFFGFIISLIGGFIMHKRREL